MLIFVSSMFLTMAFFLFVENKNHTLNLLNSLEAVMLSLLVFIYAFNSMTSFNSPSFLILLTFAACEAALGLSLLVSMLRLYGNDLISTFGSVNF
uniref:NADH-ubiquinone oxidoreductase chain 4L n=1 Tax=Ascobulla fragilis TaxID=195875 RepID=B3DFB8_ASCFR|nr:NADH dehydrogenase subunit 4L [Ascobulla fragilis]ACE62805.1 NADH dehydrogenase subunit 4L [Ascobulla fragilis]